MVHLDIYGETILLRFRTTTEHLVTGMKKAIIREANPDSDGVSDQQEVKLKEI